MYTHKSNKKKHWLSWFHSAMWVAHFCFILLFYNHFFKNTPQFEIYHHQHLHKMSNMKNNTKTNKWVPNIVSFRNKQHLHNTNCSTLSQFYKVQLRVIYLVYFSPKQIVRHKYVQGEVKHNWWIMHTQTLTSTQHTHTHI